jgi:thioredoxin reductase
MYNVTIMGSGCAGLTAAIYAARADLKPLVLDGHEPGGQLSLTTHVENFPGFPDGIMGPELIENMRRQAARFGAEFRAGTVSEVDLRQRPFKLTVGKDVYETRTVIVAAGASARLLGLKGERELIGRGVSTCATCDGYFFRTKPIAVVGGGDSPSRRISRFQNHDRSRQSKSEDRICNALRRRGNFGSGGLGYRCALKPHGYRREKRIDPRRCFRGHRP